MDYSNKTLKTDFLIIGAGIIGINIALELKRRYPASHIIILEKEKQIGAHASGRNSGVLHAGFYYTKDSLKAKFTKLGNKALTTYCLEKNIPLNRCGKLVVARDQNDLPGLQELYLRGKHNHIELELISAREALELEPRAKTFEKALFSPTTSSVDPLMVLKHLVRDAIDAGIEVHLEEVYLAKKAHVISTNKNRYSCGYIINTAGLYADKVARDFGFGKQYCILPFKGLYLYASKSTEKFKCHIYPVPNLGNPFLGVHFTITYDGKAKIGPTAIPALWREQYRLLNRFSFTEMGEILSREIGLFFKAGFDFKTLAWQEIKKYRRSILVKHAAELATDITKNNYGTWGKPGIRAQLMNLKTRKLEMDFILEGDNKSFHVLNAVSPAFTCSMPFASYVIDRIEEFQH